MKKHIIVLDASAFKESSCNLRLFNNVVLGYGYKCVDNVIEWGSAFHKFRAIFKEKGMEGFAEGFHAASAYFDSKEMMIKFDKKYLDTDFLNRACLQYATKYQKDKFIPVRVNTDILPPDMMSNLPEGMSTIPLLEQWCQFSFPYYVDDIMEILFAGTIDDISRVSNGLYCIVDCKTSGVRKDFIDSYFRSYKLSPQLRFYRWALDRYAKMYPQSVFGEINKYEVGCVIDGIFYAGRDTEIIMQRSDIILFSDTSMKKFEVLLKHKVGELIDDVHKWHDDPTYVPPMQGILNGSCQTVFGPCKYANACATNDNETYQMILDQQFIRKHYNPLNHGT